MYTNLHVVSPRTELHTTTSDLRTADSNQLLAKWLTVLAFSLKCRQGDLPLFVVANNLKCLIIGPPGINNFWPYWRHTFPQNTLTTWSITITEMSSLGNHYQQKLREQYSDIFNTDVNQPMSNLTVIVQLKEIVIFVEIVRNCRNCHIS